MTEKPAWLQLHGKNVALALRQRDAHMSRFDTENARLQGLNLNLENAVGPGWDRGIWEQYKSATGEYPFGPDNRPPDVLNAPPWVKEICGIRLNPAERMGIGG
jgi:hypothetical protein